MDEKIDTPKQKSKNSKFVIVTIIYFVVFFVIFLGYILFPSLRYRLPDWPIICLLFVFILGSLILSIAALVHNKLVSAALMGKVLAVTAILFVLIFMIIDNIKTSRHFQPPKRVICGSKLKGLGTTFKVYAHDYDDQLPTPEKWCDLLITHADVSPKSFTCEESDAKWGESSYALNKYVVGMKLSEIPGDVVLLFETNFGREDSKRTEPVKNRQFYDFLSQQENTKNVSGKKKVYKNRWNQIGGPELLTTKNHQDIEGCNILFADGYVEFVRDVSTLRWKPKEKLREKQNE